MRSADAGVAAGLFAAFFMVASFLAVVAAWFTHVIVCLKAASWGFLIAGAIFFPVAIVHGFGVWLGVF